MILIAINLVVLVWLVIFIYKKIKKDSIRFWDTKVVLASGYASFTNWHFTAYYFVNKKKVKLVWNEVFKSPKPLVYKHSKIHHIKIDSNTMRMYGFNIKDILALLREEAKKF
jgi:hypothetical protein